MGPDETNANQTSSQWSRGMRIIGIDFPPENYSNLITNFESEPTLGFLEDHVFHRLDPSGMVVQARAQV